MTSSFQISFHGNETKRTDNTKQINTIDKGHIQQLYTKVQNFLAFGGVLLLGGSACLQIKESNFSTSGLCNGENYKSPELMLWVHFKITHTHSEGDGLEGGRKQRVCIMHVYFSLCTLPSLCFKSNHPRRARPSTCGTWLWIFTLLFFPLIFFVASFLVDV